MITRLQGIIERLSATEALVDVHGVGYGVSVPVDTWEHVKDGNEGTLWICTYVREDRLELYGFAERVTLTLFELLIAQSGIGPRVGLELCAVPRELLLRAVQEDDADLLSSSVKGIGKKRAEKLLVELKSLMEKQPELFRGSGSPHAGMAHQFDQDTIAALAGLGYDTQTILRVLKELPAEISSTEERVTAALRAL
ncbi:MAG: Holliday junction ATP-dependent DNA helicase RuvA [Candidatus Peribacteraceae bacterium]|nr:Holliday junction ATP-dependent DNA helicase RuvA [Candidatus Peribacteraceae bacterium]